MGYPPVAFVLRFTLRYGKLSPFTTIPHLVHRFHRERRGGSTVAVIIAVAVTNVDGGKHRPDLTLKIGGRDARESFLDFLRSYRWQSRRAARLLLPNLSISPSS